MDDKLAAKRYAAALIAATKENELAEILSLLENAIPLFESKKFLERIRSPLIPSADKSAAFISAFGGKTAAAPKPQKSANKSLDKLGALITLLAEKNRLGALPYIVKEAKVALAGKRLAYEGVVDSQTPIDKPKLDGLAKSLTKRLGVEIRLSQSNRKYDGVRVAIDDLGVEVDFSKARISSQILGHILRGL
ncbi:MAG: F0F1 ATP synthase subunit delta [Helicobacteraceae bacterium]|jgi:F-type H+-transporting ATPase subunit delta|nr:F0F1 ATP synthase subunit delta [Helicobacteraceae bacterium]